MGSSDTGSDFEPGSDVDAATKPPLPTSPLNLNIPASTPSASTTSIKSAISQALETGIKTGILAFFNPASTFEKEQQLARQWDDMREARAISMETQRMEKEARLQMMRKKAAEKKKRQRQRKRELEIEVGVRSPNGTKRKVRFSF